MTLHDTPVLPPRPRVLQASAGEPLLTREAARTRLDGLKDRLIVASVVAFVGIGALVASTHQATASTTPATGAAGSSPSGAAPSAPQSTRNGYDDQSQGGGYTFGGNDPSGPPVASSSPS